MANFFITGADQTGEILFAGETGLVAETGTLFTNGVAVSADGQVELIVLGDIVAANSTAVVLSTTDNANITVGANGMVLSSDGTAFNGTYRNNLSIQNSGEIAGDENAMSLGMEAAATAGLLQINNSGLIRGAGSSATGGGAINFLGQSDTTNGFVLVNSGTISHGSNAAILAIDTGAVITNTGQMFGVVNLTGTQADTLTNTGSIVGAIVFGNNADSLSNQGTIIGDVQTGDMPLGDEGTTDGIDTVTNAGVIEGDVFLSAGNDVFRNLGGTVLGTVFGGFGADTFYVDRSDIDIRDSTDGTVSANDQVFSTANFTLRNGIENLALVGPDGLRGRGNDSGNFLTSGEGNDTLYGSGGGDIVNGNAGNDALFGGVDGDILNGGDGDDLLDGGRNDDTIVAGDGFDTMLGGSGDDTFSVGFQGGIINGGAGGADLATFLNIDAPLSINLATGTALIAEGVAWSLTSVEQTQGSFGADTITGSAAANRLEGFDSNDQLFGGNGNDTLLGDDGADTMTGGSGADSFVYRNTQESLAVVGIDLIADFSRNSDVIDLSAIDAVPGGSDDTFAFIGSAAFAGAAAQVRFVRDSVADTTTVEVRLAGSASTDMVIVLTGSSNLTADNFAL